MSEYKNKVLDPFSVIVMGNTYDLGSPSIVNHDTGNITKEDGTKVINNAWEFLQYQASADKCTLLFTDKDFSDICERVGVAYVDRCHDIHRPFSKDILQPRNMLIDIPHDKQGMSCGLCTITMQCDGRHIYEGKLIRVTTEIIHFNFIKNAVTGVITPDYVTRLFD